jgi:transcriptional regulator with XRE-family HTH domain
LSFSAVPFVPLIQPQIPSFGSWSQNIIEMKRCVQKRLPEGPFYRDLGRNLRTARSAAGKSQTEIAEFLDVSFQQVQKYENGKNRIPVDRLVSLAAFLEVPLLQFIDPSDSDSEFQSLAAQFGAKEFHTLMEAWGVLKDRPMRAALLNLVKRMADLKC